MRGTGFDADPLVLTVRVVRDAREWFTLETVWDPLLAQSESDGFFLTWVWVRTWWTIYGEDYQLLVIVAEDADGICGIAPLAVTRDGQLEFMGTNAAWGEYVDLIVKRGRERPVAEAIADCLLQRRDGSAPAWRNALFRFVRRDAACMPYLRSAFAARGALLSDVGHDSSPCLVLPPTWDAYLAARSANFRSWISRNENRIARRGSTRLLFAGRDVSVGDAFAWLSRLHADRWGLPFEPRFATFHRSLSAQLLPLGRLVLVLLEVGGEIVASKYDFAYAGKIWCYQGGWRKSLADHRVGHVLLAGVLRWAIEQGYREYDFLAGDAAYKRRWANTQRETITMGC